MEHKDILSKMISDSKELSVSRYIDKQGKNLFKLAKEQQLECAVGKKKGSLYWQGRRTATVPITIPYMNPLIDKSAVSYTMIADILYRKFVLGLPFYRQAMDYRMQGIFLIKQTIINWVNMLVPKICEEVYEFMTRLLAGYRYTQCDETYI